MFAKKIPAELYTLKEIPYEKWYTLLCKEQKIDKTTSRLTVKRRARSALDRFLDKPRVKEERDAVYKYMTLELGEVDLMNSLKMTKIQKSYLWPILPTICGFIAGRFREDVVKSKCAEFYNITLGQGE